MTDLGTAPTVVLMQAPLPDVKTARQALKAAGIPSQVMNPESCGGKRG